MVFFHPLPVSGSFNEKLLYGLILFALPWTRLSWQHAETLINQHFPQHTAEYFIKRHAHMQPLKPSINSDSKNQAKN
jgi:hypothetical protein